MTGPAGASPPPAPSLPRTVSTDLKPALVLGAAQCRVGAGYFAGLPSSTSTTSRTTQLMFSMAV